MLKNATYFHSSRFEIKKAIFRIEKTKFNIALVMDFTRSSVYLEMNRVVLSGRYIKVSTIIIIAFSCLVFDSPRSMDYELQEDLWIKLHPI